MKSYTSTFNFIDIPGIDYPVYSFTNEGKVFNFQRSITNTNHSRFKKLTNRSIQELKFDTLVDIDYFSTSIVKEFPIIIESDKLKSPIEYRSYYLIDYYIPSKSLCIELDSSVHSDELDRIKDQYLESLGLIVYREKDFHINILDKLTKLELYINYLPDKVTNINFLYTINKLKSFNIKKREDILHFMKPKWRNIINKLNEELDNNIINSIINNNHLVVNTTLDDLYKVIPSKYKSFRSYNYLINYLKSYNIHIKLN